MRVSDPPARPQFHEATPDELVEWLHQAGEAMAWDALGLDPASDGSHASVVRVRDAEEDGPPGETPG